MRSKSYFVYVNCKLNLFSKQHKSYGKSLKKDKCNHKSCLKTCKHPMKDWHQFHNAKNTQTNGTHTCNKICWLKLARTTTKV